MTQLNEPAKFVKLFLLVRSIHTNLRTRFKCDTLKLAMIKTEWLAKTLFGGKLYDCVCVFEEGTEASFH